MFFVQTWKIIYIIIHSGWSFMKWIFMIESNLEYSVFRLRAFLWIIIFLTVFQNIGCEILNRTISATYLSIQIVISINTGRKFHKQSHWLRIWSLKNFIRLKIFLLSCKRVKKGECSAPLCSFNFKSKLMWAANCARLYLNCFCCEVNSLMYLKTNKTSDKTVHNFQLASAKIKSKKTRVVHYILFFSLYYTIKALNRKLKV